MKTKDAEEYFETYRDSLQRELVRLASYVRLFRRLHERKADRLREMNLAPAFFSITIDAVYSAIVLWVDKLFGSRSERGLVNFLNFIEQNRGIFDIKELSGTVITPMGVGCCKIENLSPLKVFKRT